MGRSRKTARQAIHGLGGVGKTRLAVEYAWRYQADYTALLFVFADTAANLRRNLAALTEPLRLPQQEAQEEEVRVAAVLRWLEDKNGWLFFRRTVSILKHFNDSTSHEHPHWRAALANYSGLLQAMGLSQEEIARRLHDVAEHPASRSAPSHASKGF
jgi:hypothetical protein